MTSSVAGSGSPEASSGTQALDRAAAIVTYVVEADHPVGFAEVVETSGLARSTVSRMLAALERSGLLERLDTGEWRGGPLFVLYAARHDRTAQVARLARPLLEKVGEDTGETVHLAVAHGERVAHIDQVDSTFLLGARDWSDVDVPPHTSALGKVLLAWKVLPIPDGHLATLTDQTISRRADLEDDLEQVRTRGYAVTHDELEIGLSGLAAPVFDPGGDVVAAVGVSGPTARLESRAEEVGQLLVAHTRELSRQLTPGHHTKEPR
ncbi:IclR family transcriptional regulator [Nocardioides korecus]